MKKLKMVIMGVITVTLVSFLIIETNGIKPLYKEKTVKADKITMSKSEVVEDTVHLYEIKPPKYERTFAEIQIGSQTCNVAWGESVKSAVMCDCGSFPGFGRPILIDLRDSQVEDKQLNDVNVRSIVSLSTEYGSFYYQIQEIHDGTFVDNKLVDTDTRIQPFNPAQATEVLYVVSEGTEKYYVCTLNGGTVITL